MKNSKKSGKQMKTKKSISKKSLSKKVARPVETVEVKETAKKNQSSKTSKKKMEVVENPNSFSKKFDHPVRTYWNRRYEKKNSSCAKPGTELDFEQINVRKDGVIEYRVRRGKRNFFTTSKDMEAEG